MDNANVPAHLEVVHPVVSQEAVDPHEGATIPAVMAAFDKLQEDFKFILGLVKALADLGESLVCRIEKLEGLPQSAQSETVSVDVVNAEPEPAQEAPPVARGTHSDGYRAFVDGLNRGE